MLFWRLALRRVFLVVAAVLFVLGLALSQVEASPIVSPISATASNSFPDPTFGTVANLINHGGLLTDFTSGVTNFDAYLALNPQHTVLSSGAEWFTDFSVTSAVLTFDLGATMLVDKVAVWNDEFWGAGRIAVAMSLNNVTYTSFGSFVPTDWPANVNAYGANVFSFGPTTARFARLTLSGCPQRNGDPSGGCSLGEVAFSGQTVPEPMTLALVGGGLAGIAASRRRRPR